MPTTRVCWLRGLYRRSKPRIGSTRKVVLLLALVILLFLASMASAARPVKDGHYSGHLRISNPSPPRITFEVSKDGTEVRDLEVSYPPLLCALGGMTPPQQQAEPTPISRRGTFTETVSFATSAGKVGATVEVTGRFRRHHRVTGKARVRWIGGFGPGCGGTVRYSARAR